MNKFFCISAMVCLASLAAAEPPVAWNVKSSSGWKDEKVEAKSAETWKQPAVREDAQGQGWVSSESGEDFRPQSIPTSWQKVQKQNSDWVKSSGWEEKKVNSGWDKSALNPASQAIAKGLIVKHPLPTLKLSSWTPSPLSADGWDKEASAEEWKRDSVIKSATPTGWEKDASLEQWQQKQAAAAASSGWNTKSRSFGWEKDTNAASAAAWQKDASNKKSAYAAADAASAQYQKQAALNAWHKKQASATGWEEKSASNGWKKESLPAGWEKAAALQDDASSEGAWQKDSAQPAWNDVPAGWEKEDAAANAGWQKDATPSGWDADSDFKAWQKETAANGWDKNTAAKAWQKDAVSNGWEKEAVNGWEKAAAASAWQKDAASNGWEKDSAPTAIGWANDNANKNAWQSASEVYNEKKARGPAPSKWVK